MPYIAPDKPNQTQVGGSHYTDLKIQPWDVLESWLGRAGFADYLRGNVLKYLARYRAKNGVEDLLKCEHYLKKLIEVESSTNAKAK